jgi:hypothetical protein
MPPVEIEMPDGTIKTFSSLEEAKDFKNALMSDPYTGGALQMSGGDTGLAKDTLDIVNKGLEAQSKARDLEGRSPTETVEEGLNMLEKQLSEIPRGERGILAKGRGIFEYGKGLAGYNPNVSTYQDTRKAFSRPLIKFLGEKGALSGQDVEAAEGLLPPPWSTYEEANKKFDSIRELTGIKRRPLIQAPKQGGNIE